MYGKLVKIVISFDICGKFLKALDEVSLRIHNNDE